MIKSFKQFESAPSENFDSIMDDVKNHFNDEYIDMYIMDNYDNYCDSEEMEEAGYDDQVKYYKEVGAGGNGIEYDLINEIWDYLKEEHNINLSDKKYEDLNYSINYYIKEHFPYFYFVDYRIETPIQKMMKSITDLDNVDGIKL